jgi:FtsP/CotA-like multicopper oxidase with cupredoxin domain
MTKSRVTSFSLFALAAAGALLLPQAAQAQTGNQFIACINAGQPLLRIPELVRKDNGVLRGSIQLTAEANRMNLGATTPNGCVPQYVRAYRGLHATLPGYQGTIPAGFPGATPPQPAVPYADPMPGPTLRARVGDLVELTFLNQIDANVFGASIDRGEHGQGCDESSAPYPSVDTFPDCFHGSSTGNIHYHGTHTNPRSTGDNVFVEVRPSLRKNGQPVVTEASVTPLFNEFFHTCEQALAKGPLVQWPFSWDDLPKGWINQQIALLKQYDNDPANREKLLPVDLAQRAAGAWPQYYIGAYPFCYRLPEYKEATWPPKAPMVPSMHAMQGMSGPPAERPLVMGQAPGTHWYHAHKHGSTTINVSNGMTGVFIIEGKYDDELDAFYGAGWTRTQPIIALNELGVSPNLYTTKRGPLPFQVNGRPQPAVSMQSGEVQMWRIVDSASRSGAFFVGPPQGFAWKQLAQDGVQFSNANYQSNDNKSFLMAAGNRVDLLIKAPVNGTNAPQSFPLLVRQSINDQQSVDPTRNTTLLTIVVQPGPAVTGNRANFIPNAPSFPPFLADIQANEVTGSKKVVFESVAPPPPPAPQPPANGAPFTQHLINGKKFDGNVGEVVLLNTVEEWTIENRTTSASPSGPINHPFHIHINPFQIVELFDPLEAYIDPQTHQPAVTLPPNPNPNRLKTTYVPKYVFSAADKKFDGQCLLDPKDASTWKPCGPQKQSDHIWWDVFPIPSGAAITVDGKPVIVPGYFKMRSRFVDYTGQYVMHCHILAHEDRGMMTVVEVVPFTTPYSHM